jgi:uncharacterized membrane protein
MAMPDDPAVDPVETTPAVPLHSRLSKRVKFLLAASLALNLAVAGLFVGAVIKTRGDRPPSAVSDLNFGPFSEALTREQRKQMRRAFLEHGPSLKDMRAQMRDDLVNVATALRAEPFDPEAMRTAFEMQDKRINARIALGREAIMNLILSMSPADRAGFADRLEKALNRHGRDDTKPRN